MTTYMTYAELRLQHWSISQSLIEARKANDTERIEDLQRELNKVIDRMLDMESDCCNER